MVKMIQLRALRRFPYGKNYLAEGEVFDVSEKLGAVFIHEKRAAPLDAPRSVDLPAEVMSRASKREPITEQEEVKAKPVAPLSYKTRHMEAEKPGLTIQPVGQPVPVENPKAAKVAAKAVEAPAPKKRGRPFGPSKKSR